MDKTINLNTGVCFAECVIADQLAQILSGIIPAHVEVELWGGVEHRAKNIKIIRKYEVDEHLQRTGALHEFRFRDGLLDVVMVRSRCGWCIYDQYLDRSHKCKRSGFVYPRIITASAIQWASERHTLIEYFKINKPRTSNAVSNYFIEEID